MLKVNSSSLATELTLKDLAKRLNYTYENLVEQHEKEEFPEILLALYKELYDKYYNLILEHSEEDKGGIEGQVVFKTLTETFEEVVMPKLIAKGLHIVSLGTKEYKIVSAIHGDIEVKTKYDSLYFTKTGGWVKGIVQTLNELFKLRL